MKEKITYIDGLKGIACFCIAINHFINIFYSGNIASKYNNFLTKTFNEFPLCRLLYNGNFYLMIFFAISSFLISYLLLKKNDIEYYKKTLFKRWGRICIPVGVLCVIIYVMDKFNAFSYLNPLMKITLSTTKDVNCFKGLTLLGILTTTIKCMFIPQTSFNFVFWMLPLLYKGFFITVILTLMIRNIKIKKVMILLTLAGIVVYTFINSSLVVCIVGIGIAYLFYKKDEMSFYNNNACTIIAWIILIIGLYFGSAPYNNEFNNYYSILKYIPGLTYIKLHILGAIFTFSAIMLLNPVKRFLSCKPLAYMGKISFAIYLIHFPIASTICAYLFVKMYNILNSYIVVLIITLIIYIILLIWLSGIFYKYVEKNAEKINNNIIDKII